MGTVSASEFFDTPVDNTTVTLEWYELAMATDVAMRRQIDGMRLNKKTNAYFHGDPYTARVKGAMGEIAFAKWNGIYWNGSVNTFKEGADVGKNYQIRTRAKSGQELIVRKNDSDDQIFVLVSGTGPTFKMEGWLYGREAKQDRYWREWTNGGPPTWAVPPKELHPMESLP